MNKKLEVIYKRLFKAFGPQYWWPAEDNFEVMVGAILTQSTNWGNVEKAIANLKKEKLLAPDRLLKLSHKKLTALIRPAGYYNIKALRLKELLKFIFRESQGNLGKLSQEELGVLREKLLNVKGIGPETADSILLYALHKPIFVVDAYTKRIFSRHNFLAADCSYTEAQNLFMQNLKPDVKLFNEYHALIVKLAKEYCKKNKPKCEICPLR